MTAQVSHGRVGRARRQAWKRIKRFGRTLREFPGTLLLGVLLVFVGVILLERYHASEAIEAKLAGLFLSELGFAFLIAAIIFAMLEEWAAKEHCKTAIGHLYGVRPVGRFFRKIEKYVLEQQYYRGKVIIEYDFQKREEDYILVCYSLAYQVFNKCTHDDVQPLVIAGAATKKTLHIGTTKWDSILGVRRVVLDGRTLLSDELAIVEDEESRTQSYRVKRPISLRLDEGAQVETSHYLLRHDHDATAWTAAVPSLGAELRIKWDPAIPIKFVAEAMHPEVDRLTEARGPSSLTLKLDEPFLIGHGFHFWWSLVEDNSGQE